VAEATPGPIGVANHLLIFKFFLKLGMGAFLEKKKKKKSKWSNCNNLKVWGVKFHVLNIGGQSANGWMVQGVKYIFP
jgi:hypothetical protein